MIEQILSQYTGISANQIARILSLKQAQVYEDPDYQAWISQLDPTALYETLPLARAAYEQGMPQFAEHLRDNYGLDNTKMSPFTLGNWLVGFLQYPNTITNLAKLHHRIPPQAFREMLPMMLTMLDTMPDGGAQWQRALALMALPLLVRRN